MKLQAVLPEILHSIEKAIYFLFNFSWLCCSRKKLKKNYLEHCWKPTQRMNRNARVSCSSWTPNPELLNQTSACLYLLRIYFTFNFYSPSFFEHSNVNILLDRVKTSATAQEDACVRLRQLQSWANTACESSCRSQEQKSAEPAPLQAMTHSPGPVDLPTRQMCVCK